MENLLNNAKQFLGTEQGRNMESQFEKATGIDVDKYVGGNNQGQQSGNQQGQNQNQGGFQGQNQNQQDQFQGQNQQDQFQNQQNQGASTDAFGNQGQQGQYGEPGQYGAVRGEGLGGALNQGQGQGGQGQSAYEGMGQDDSTSTGGYGGAAFSRRNQMGADAAGPEEQSDDGHGGGYATGTSTPGYRQEGDVDAEAAENRIRNQNLNVYGQQSDETNEKDDQYHEPNI